MCDSVEEFWDAEALRHAEQVARRTTADDFMAALKTYLGAEGTMHAASSGREALRAFLTGSRRSADRRHVLICSFNCKAVTDAVITAGFTPETYDLGDPTGAFDWDAVGAKLGDEHHAIVVCHLFGVPSDIRPLLPIAARKGVLVVEDCAHTVGGRIGGRAAGALGDAAVFSFNYDKPISLGGGGALLVNRSGCAAPEPPTLSVAAERAELAACARYLRHRREIRPGLLARVRGRLAPAPEMGLAKGFGPLRAALGLWQLERYDEIRRRRNANAQALLDTPGWRPWRVDADVSPAWLRMKLVPDAPLDAAAAVRPLHAAGLRVGGFNWPTTVDGALGQPERPNAEYAARYAVDAPVHQEMTPAALEFIARTLAKAAFDAPGPVH